MKRKKNYLNNKDLLKEIHLSKISYCSFINREEDNQQDIIVDSVDEIGGTEWVEVGKDPVTGKVIFDDVPVIDLAKKARASRLTKAGIPTMEHEIALTDLVFRVMTVEHIPLVPKKKSKAALVKEAKEAKALAIFDELVDEDDTESIGVQSLTDPTVIMIPMRCGFLPFFHYKIINKELYTKMDIFKVLKSNNQFLTKIVGKSHWKGDIDTGEFCKDNGNTTDKLAMMYIKICERYGGKGNWRGYTYNDEMQSQAILQLAAIGLQFNEKRSQNPFSYYTSILTNAFRRVLNIEKQMQATRDDILEKNNLTPSWTRQYENQKDPQIQDDFYKKFDNIRRKKQ